MRDTSPKGHVAEYVSALISSERFRGQIAHHRVLPATVATHGSCVRPWPYALEKLLCDRQVSLYSHQATAIDHIRAGQSVVVATPTASGKSLIYNLPVLERYLKDPDAKALYLFPLKALAQDQFAAFQKLCGSWPKDSRPVAALYDGDTSAHFRRKIRMNPPTALVSNPEMLHLAILPHHEQWVSFLAGLTHVIVDEAHTYRGVFGAHMAQVFRRLNRLVALYGAEPTYIFCTATVGNPGELAASLLGARESPQPVVIDRSGAPQGRRHYVFMNPELSPSSAAIDLLKAALARKLRTIVYCRSRRMTELISIWAGGQSFAGKISAYRAGFLPEERREIEARMASGDLLAVVSTSALELGIDIGGLDICILVGYPGTVMATMQRGGRVGRAQQESAVIMIAGEDALDQYFARNPEDFFSRPPEKAVVDPDNEVILARHLECAAAEHRLAVDEKWLSSQAVRRAIRDLADKGLLLQSADGGHWLAARKRPHRHVDLRGTGQSYSIVDEKANIIGNLDGFRVWRETHPGAVYLHRGKSYIIKDVLAETGEVKAQAAAVSWFTRTRGNKQTEILNESSRVSLGRLLVCYGRLRITEQITGYEKRTASGNRLLGIFPLEAPPQIFETEGFWYVIPDAIRLDLEKNFIHFMGSIHALEHALIGLMPLFVMADRNDFGGISTPLHPQTGLPTIFVYDGLPGGAGLSRQAFGQSSELLEAALRCITGCSCEDGCPSCVHSPKCGSGNRPISKDGARILVEALLSDGNEGRQLGSTVPCCRTNEVMPEITLGRRSEPPQHFLVFDIETRRSAQEVGGWHKADQMGVSIAVAYDSREDAFFSYTQEELAGLFARMKAAELVIGFNSLRFDYAVLSPFAPFNLRELPSLDLLQRISAKLNYRVSLDNLGQATFNTGKSADGLQALQWWKDGKLEDIRHYCQSDVDLTLKLYRYGLEHGYLLFRNKAGQKVRLPVDFAL